LSFAGWEDYEMMNLGSPFLDKIRSHFFLSALLPAELFADMKKGFPLSDSVIIAKPDPPNQNTYESSVRAGTSLF